jgi:Domain of unknown function (DUF4145)
MKCPHCGITFHDEFSTDNLHNRTSNLKLQDVGYDIHARSQSCPECDKAIVLLEFGRYESQSSKSGIGALLPPRWVSKRIVQVYPKGSTRPVPSEVPADVVNDFKEASDVIQDSPKASAALSRRLLQRLLREQAKVKPGDLSDEIQEVLDSNQLPSSAAQAIDAVRNIGNFAAHPIKSKDTGVIVDVEPGEAEWLLDTLESLFDIYFVQPLILARKRAELDKKLEASGKPPMK